MGQFDRFRSELWSFTYLAVRRVLSLLVLALRRSGSKEIEILVLPVGADNSAHPAQATIGYSWTRPPRRSALRSLARSTSPISAGAVSSAHGARWLRDRWGRCAL